MSRMSNDTIYREDVINTLADMHCKSDEDGYVWIIRSDALARIDALPSAQPERKKGFWIPQDFNKSNGMITTAVYYLPKCSVCGLTSFDTNFCPNCGADMRGEQDERSD